MLSIPIAQDYQPIYQYIRHSIYVMKEKKYKPSKYLYLLLKAVLFKILVYSISIILVFHASC